MATEPSSTASDLTSFVGRKHDIAAVRQLLSTARLVTLTGIGGVGKTRLALRVAHEVRRAYPDGVRVVELAGLTEPDLLPHTVIDALSIRSGSTQPPIELLGDYLRPRRMLIVLDNCEHLVDASADLADKMLRAAPHVQILATSRQALRITGEHVYGVVPLPIPDPEIPIPAGTATQFPAVALFVDRSTAAVPGFELTSANEDAAVRLCHRLEGIPLAIELASVRLRVLTIEDLANRLDDRFQALGNGNRNLPERHRTLQAMVDWSSDLCTPAERTLWSRASVFAGGFSLEALEAVCTDDRLPVADVVDTVAGLLDKSIFVREMNSSTSRFHMLDTLRAYGQVRLAASGEEAVFRDRHCDWFRQRVEAAGDEWVGPQQMEWAASLEADHANLRSALEHSMTGTSDAQTGLRFASMPWFWFAMGHLAEGRHWIERALAIDNRPTKERAWALSTGAYLAAAQGQYSRAHALLDEARELAGQLGDRPALAYATHVSAVCRTVGGDHVGAILLFQNALDLYTESAVPSAYPELLRTEMAAAYVLVGETDQAATLIEGLIDRSLASGERWQLSYGLWGRGLIRVLKGALDDAEADLLESIAIKRSFHDTLGLALALDVLAWTAAAKGDGERSAVLFGGTDNIWTTLGSRLLGSTHLIAHRERFENTARKKVGSAAFDAAVSRGNNLDLDAIISYALRETGKHEQGSPPYARLTRREREVAELVSEGLSNKDIATRLVISIRTAEGHVENILTKLGFTSRTQLAGWILRQ